MSHEEWKELTHLNAAHQHQQEVLATSPDGQREIVATHFTVGGETQDLQYEQTYLSLQLINRENPSYKNDALVISLKTYSTGQEEQFISLGVLDQSQSEYVTNYDWASENNGFLSHVVNQTGISRKTLKILKDSGIAVISKKSALPNRINVEDAVNHWFAKIGQMIKNPQDLTNIDLSVSGTISPFEI